MRLLADECCERALVEALRRAGHDVVYILEHKPGASDREIVEFARREARVLITDDKDFGELIVRRTLRSNGVILLRIAAPDVAGRERALRRAIERFGDKLERQFTVLRSNVTRVRLLPE